jgi:F0F1-type ATP synthase assembly protein I
MEPTKKPLADTVRQLGALSSVGLSFVLAIVIGVGAGVMLDRWLGTSPWMFFLFFVFGLAAGVLNVYRAAGRFLK